MSHLLEEYAKNLGVKIAKPIVSKHFWPLSEGKFITFSLEGSVPAKQYKYYSAVIEIIKPILDKEGIAIFQIGPSSGGTIKGIRHHVLDLSFRQNAYILSKSMLHVGTDGALCHYANSIATPLVILFGNVYASIAKGFWNKNQELIEAPWPIKPCLNVQDPQDAINKIKPETIAKSIFKQLNIIPAALPSTKFIGQLYNHEIIEVIPNFFSPIRELQDKHVFLRPDLGFNKEPFFNWCGFLSKFSAFSKEAIPLNFLEQYKAKIVSISFIVDINTSLTEEYLFSIKNSGINPTILVKKKEELPLIREKFFDFSVQWFAKGSKDELKDCDINFGTAKFKSSKIVFGDGKKYCCQHHFQQGKNCLDNCSGLDDNEVLLEDLQHFLIYE